MTQDEERDVGSSSVPGAPEFSCVASPGAPAPNGSSSHLAQENGKPSTSEAVAVQVNKKGKRNGKPITEKWRPIYVWLEALNQREVVRASEITEWLEAHPDVRQNLRLCHTNEHVFNYIQKCHSRMISDPRKRSKNIKIDAGNVGVQSVIPEGRVKRVYKKLAKSEPIGRVQPSMVRRGYKRKRWCSPGSNGAPGSSRLARSDQHSTTFHGVLQGGKHTRVSSGMQSSRYVGANIKMDQDVAQKRFQILADLKKELVSLLGNFEQIPEEKVKKPDNHVETLSQSHPGNSVKRGRDPVAVFAWSFCETSSALSASIWKGQPGGKGRLPDSLQVAEQVTTNIFKCLMDREQGGNSATDAYRPKDIGKHGRRWTSFVEGWNAIDKQFKAPVSWLQQQAHSSWCASWCAYTSSVALAPVGRVDQGVQKVLDIRLHPGGLPQLVCSCNAAPNELLLYNLVNGRARELAGHNCQIQAVEYALNGERIISCGTNVLKVWDSASGSCLHTMGPRENEGTAGHKKKISAMSVHQAQSCLVATSGGEGESEILLWNVRTGELASDLNAEMRQTSASLSSMDALKFCQQNLLICGSDSAGAQPAVVQIWDVDALKELVTYPASDSYITCLNTDPQGSTIIAGSGDGSVGLFDLRLGGAIARLPLGLKCEATSVSFSACGTYFHSSSTANHTLVWDTRMMPMDPGLTPKDRPIAVSKLNSYSSRPLHCLSHGDPMPTTQNAGQLPGYVDEGDGGVNDARWFQGTPVLVTASGNGSIALWDVTLGQPCLRLLSSHSRCINTVAISPNDKLICSGGDDQKVVLYHRLKFGSMGSWRLTHPLSDDLQPISRFD